MCGLLAAVSLYPLGSQVESNDGRTAMVCRANATAYDRPVLMTVNGPSGQAGMIDLIERPDLKVVRIKTSDGEHRPAETAGGRRAGRPGSPHAPL